MIEKGISDLKTIKGLLNDLKGWIATYEEHPQEAGLRGVGNFAGLLAERITMRRLKGAP